MTEDDTFDALRKAPTEDEKIFGRRAWIYCNQHLRPHETGWCSVSAMNKVKLDASTYEDAVTECKEKKYELHKGY